MRINLVCGLLFAQEAMALKYCKAGLKASKGGSLASFIGQLGSQELQICETFGTVHRKSPHLCCKKVTTLRNTKQLKMQQLLKYWNFVCGGAKINQRPVERTSKVQTPGLLRIQMPLCQLNVLSSLSHHLSTLHFPHKSMNYNHI